jgi:hypothetical protein
VLADGAPVPAGALGGTEADEDLADGAEASGGWASDLMSIRQPVSRAASRAFWPSLPMASDSW